MKFADLTCKLYFRTTLRSEKKWLFNNIPQ